MVVALILSTVLLVSSVPIHDGDTLTQELPDHGESRYEFVLNSAVHGRDLYIFLTPYEDFSDPDLYVRGTIPPSRTQFEFKSQEFGTDQILIPHTKLGAQTYHVLVYCQEHCHFSISLTYSESIALHAELPIYATIEWNSQRTFSYDTACDEDLIIEMHPADANFTMNVMRTEGNVTSDLYVDSLWDYGKVARSRSAGDASYEVTVSSVKRSSFMIFVDCGGEVQVPLAKLINGRVKEDSMKYFRINSKNLDSDVTIILQPRSGDPDLYVAFGTRPTTEVYDYISNIIKTETIEITETEIELAKRKGDFIMIGVYGFTAADFTLSIKRKQNSVVELNPGISYSGTVLYEKVNWHRLEIPKLTDFNVTIELQALSGNPDVYAKLCSTKNSSGCSFSEDELKHPENYENLYLNQDAAIESITFAHSRSDCTSSCQYLVVVRGNAAGGSDYRLTVLYGDHFENFLNEADPVHLTVSTEVPRFFRFYVSDETVKKVKFELQSESGNADLYVSRYVRMPDAGNAEKSSFLPSLLGDQVVYTQGKDKGSLVGDYHIAVRSAQDSLFTLIAVIERGAERTPITLYPGITLQGTVNDNEEERSLVYTFSVFYEEGSEQEIIISLVPQIGMVQLFVANSPDAIKNHTFYYQWCLCDNVIEETVLKILPEDASYKGVAEYSVFVKGFKYSNDRIASFFLTYTGENTITSLIEGVPLPGIVEKDKYQKYSWLFPDLNYQISLFLNVFSGDADLYANIGTPNPVRGQSQFVRQTFGSDSIKIDHNDITKYCSINELCRLYVSAFGSDRSDYSILLKAVSSVPTLLIPNEVFTGALEDGLYAYYYAVVDISLNLEIRCHSLLGDDGLVVNVIDRDVEGNASSKWDLPTRRHKQYAAFSPIFDNVIRMTPTELQERCLSYNCGVAIGIYCDSKHCQYSLSYVQDSALLIKDNESVQGRMKQGEFTYFKYRLSSETESLLFLLTSYGGSDPDLYVSMDGFPDKTTYQWKMDTFGGETLMIHSNDTEFSIREMTGVYLIGVTSAEDGVFSLLVTANVNPILPLLEAIPQHRITPRYSSSYFYFYNTILADIDFELTTTRGNCMILASTYHIFTLAEMREKLPTSNVHTWDSVTSGDGHSLTVRTHDSEYCMYCYFVLAVVTNKASCEYTIAAVHDLNLHILRPGVATRSIVYEDNWKYYMYTHSTQTAFKILLHSFNGDADIYVSDKVPVTTDNFIWQSHAITQGEKLDITTTDENFFTGVYYIGVKGFKSTRFSLVITTEDSIITLIDGLTVTYSLSGGSLKFSVSTEGAAELTCHIQSLDELMKPSMFLSFEKDGSTIPFPSTESSDFHYTAQSGYDPLFNSFEFYLRPEERGRFLILIEDPDKISSSTNNINFYCTSFQGILTITENSQHLQKVSGTQTALYQLEVSSQGLLVLHLAPCIGEVTLELSRSLSFKQEADIIITNIEGAVQATVSRAEGTFYARVIVTRQALEAVFLLYPQVSYQGDDLPLELLAGSGGEIHYRESGSSTIYNWAPAEYSDRLTIPEIFYYFYSTKDPAVNLHSACGMRTAAKLGLAEELQLDSSFLNKKTSTGTFVNVLAIDMKLKDSIFGYAAYSSIQVTREQPDSGTSWLLLSGLLFVVLALTGGLICCCKRLRRPEPYEGYELASVRLN